MRFRMRVVGHRPRGYALALLLIVAGVVAGRAHATADAVSGRIVQSQPCGGVRASPGYRHVIWIWFENHSYDAVIGSPQAPFTNRLAADCGLATNYHNITHPSLPNYIAATSGSTQGITDDCQPGDCSRHAANLFAQLRAAHVSWNAYEESIPRPCDLTAGAGSDPPGDYAPKHDPALYYLPRAGCRQRVVPLGTPTSGPLARALAGGTLPGFSFVTPNLCNDTHDCAVGIGDRWLARWMAAILASRSYQAGHTVVFVTWDEGEGGSSSTCATNASDAGCHVATLVVSPSTKPRTRSPALFNHYSLLKTAEQLLGVKTFLGHAGDPDTRSLRAAFGL
jgi:hypothetical protein